MEKINSEDVKVMITNATNLVVNDVDQSVALVRCYNSPSCSDSGLQLFCIVGSRVLHLIDFLWG